eukprot:CAMPEP_0173196198 /NCGR_PEP_ID=MMETSP1141-20130122/15481_1 /TAXON_ID=483371 /ORGANISM="non described non described, Strain CCMP2298" /LENGTH=37 /DNA_ID= /DNA_START= /DNA_END= /DNA_ORIENTATION=
MSAAAGSFILMNPKPLGFPLRLSIINATSDSSPNFSK